MITTSRRISFDTARAYGIEDHVYVVHGVVESVSRTPDGTVVLKLRDNDFRVLAYVPGEVCSTGSVFASQIGAVRTAVAKHAFQVGDSVIVRSLILFGPVTAGGAKSGVVLTPVLGVTTTNGTTYGLTEVSTP
jgi:hypothetical protein